MSMNNFIELKKRCEFVVAEADLTKVLYVLDSFGCKNVTVKVHYHAEKRDNISWRVAFRASAWEYACVCQESKEVCSHELLISLKDVFGNTRYQEA